MSRLQILKLLILLSPFWVSAIGLAKNPRSISVTGQGTVAVVPDQVELTVGIEVTDKNVLQCKKKSDEVMRRILAVAKAQKVADKDIQSDYVLIEAERSGGIYPAGAKADEPSIFRARRTVRILLRELPRYESLVAALFEGGANTLSQVQFLSSKEESLGSEALIGAVKAARQKAELLAKEAGLKLGKALSMEDRGRQHPVPMGMAKMSMMDGGAPTLAVGELGISAEVQVVFEAE